MEAISNRLKQLVDQSVTILGEVIQTEMGMAGYRRIERVRKEMASLRGAAYQKKIASLRSALSRMEKLRPLERLNQAKAFTLMLELMNACENAYRNFSIREKALPLSAGRPDAVIYVLTAHPTEARAPGNIWVFHEIQKALSQAMLEKNHQFSPEVRESLRHLIALAWRVPVVRSRKPRVEDEATHIFSTLLREETLRPLLHVSHSLAPVFIRSWVGGDKDGHPGVNAKTFRASLQISRALLLKFVHARLREVQEAVDEAGLPREVSRAMTDTRQVLQSLRIVRAGDGARAARLRKSIRALGDSYARAVEAARHPALAELFQLLKMFPALAVPLELRESSDMLPAAIRSAHAPISQMLSALASISSGGDPRWYARGMIISMASSISHIHQAARLVKRALGGIRVPVIPLFEQAEALDTSPEVMRAMISDTKLSHARKKFWDGYLEVMVGYSDSSKQSGVLPSRLKIATAMHELDQIARNRRVTPLFFQGSGGSVDRGGGSIAEQTAWWPSGALKNYKVTIQGEMVERSMASSEITYRQLQRIVDSAGRWNKSAKKYVPGTPVRAFAEAVAGKYQRSVADPAFLRMIEEATPYLFLDRLRIGSRPTKRAATTLNVNGLRAIPWVLCWTQTRVLFPTWWGTGSAWAALDSAGKRKLKKAFGRDPVFTVFVRALAYTLAKIEMPVFHLYVERSRLSALEKEKALELLLDEEALARRFLREIGKVESRPWLFESISLRSPMIHPLNLLQLVALEKDEPDLLRLTVTGIANGMVSTG